MQAKATNEGWDNAKRPDLKPESPRRIQMYVSTGHGTMAFNSQLLEAVGTLAQL